MGELKTITYEQAKRLALGRIAEINTCFEYEIGYNFLYFDEKGNPRQSILISKSDGSVMQKSKIYENGYSQFLYRTFSINRNGEKAEDKHYYFYLRLGAVKDWQCCFFDCQSGWVFDADGDYFNEDNYAISPEEAYRIITDPSYSFRFFRN